MSEKSEESLEESDIFDSDRPERLEQYEKESKELS
jgi:hypothetical protein